MRSSPTIAVLFAGLAIASPLKQVAKKAYVYDYVTDIVVVTVTDRITVDESTTAAALPTVDVQAAVVAATTSSSVVVVTASPIVDIVTVTLGPSTGDVPTSVAVPTTPEVIPTSTPVAIPATSVVTVVPVAAVASTSEEPLVAVETSSPAISAAVDTTDASDASSSDPIAASLYHHNIHRTNHSAPAVTWNGTLANFAATVASSCVYAHNLGPGGGGYGQNIAVFGETGNVKALGEAHEIAQASTDMWYNGEIGSFLPSYYGQANPDFSNFDAWGHFSQIVWKSTEEIGCASQYCGAGTIFDGFGSWFTVCNYGPEGNMGGEYGANVLEPLGHPSVSVTA